MSTAAFVLAGRSRISNHSSNLSHSPPYRYQASSSTRLLVPFASDAENEAVNSTDVPVYVQYLWSLPRTFDKDPSLVADTLLELGASLASVVLSAPVDVSSDESFARTGRISLNRQSVPFVDPKNPVTVNFWMVAFEDDAYALDVQAEILAKEALRAVVDNNDDPVIGHIKRMVGDDVSCEMTSSDSYYSTSNAKIPNDNKLIVNGKELSIMVSIEDDDEIWAFGNGGHPSTVVSICGLEDFANSWKKKGPFSLLDYGCGTGILTLAGLAFGAGTRVTAVDISDDALRLTKENIHKNYEGVSDDIQVETLHHIDEGPDYWEHSYDAVVANIPANTLTALLPILAKAVGDEGKIMTAGYPASELEFVSEEARKYGLEEEKKRRRYDSGWVLQVFSR